MNLTLNIHNVRSVETLDLHPAYGNSNALTIRFVGGRHLEWHEITLFDLSTNIATALVDAIRALPQPQPEPAPQHDDTEVIF
ncbi:hypothetical protein [Amaricoccus solimangrovi]|uniref:Uncharacterized protein n=1 Tax=Amaricoccus solimangrovi TaxID=2589815 RepID=A0A501WXT2_9RHOB|nr:hypothetical protein [Amaricoccus solimangrovi]TPE53055.1 hypothetical protein FJM51_03245 [Amaricoccus solimangrovi]